MECNAFQEAGAKEEADQEDSDQKGLNDITATWHQYETLGIQGLTYYKTLRFVAVSEFRSGWFMYS